MKEFMENLDEYILRFQQYKEGNYEYNPITSFYDVKKLVEHGKKIVFIGSKVDSLVWFTLIGILLIAGLISGLAINSFHWFVFTALLLFIGIPCIIFFFLGLWKLRTRFMVLGPEGIAYKLRNRRVKGYNWADIMMDFYNLSFVRYSNSFKIHIFMLNGDLIKVELDDYSCKEISVNRYSLNKVVLFTLIFVAYYDYGKNGTFTRQTRRFGDHITNPQSVKGAINTDILIIDTWEDQLKEALYNYKKKNYKYDKYWTSEQIHDAFLRKKIFVLKGGVFLFWLIILLPFVVIFILILVMIPSIIENWNLIKLLDPLIIISIYWLIMCTPFFLILRRFLVISSSGVYYRNYIRKNIFAWEDVSKIEGIEKNPKPVVADVEIYLLNGKKIKFASNLYKNREFSKKVYVEMFFNLFNSNFKLSKDRFHIFRL